MSADFSTFEQLAFSTIRIECDLAGGGRSTGTGFFSRFAEEKDTSIPAIVTNKHVVKGGATGHLHFTLAKEDGEPDVGKTFLWTIPQFELVWIPHPDPSVDLCAMAIGPLLDQAAQQGHSFFYKTFDFDLLPSEKQVEDFVGLERIVMIGYPNGIWDQKHNFPVFRSGVVATHYRYDWNGQPRFLIDCACFPGSSGSPVVIFDVGFVYAKSGVFMGSNRLLLLGVLFAGPQLSADGKLEIVPIPTADQVISRTNIPINLGMVIKSRKLRELDDAMRKAAGL